MPSRNRHIIPIAIGIAIILITAAIYTTFGHRTKTTTTEKSDVPTSVTIRPIDASDHILGNPNAPVIMVEYSDLECPFCKRHHDTLKQIMNEYGKIGQVAWVYRHFPIVQLHSKAPTEALATECAAAQGGNTAFWAMLDNIFTTTPSNNGLDLKQLPVFAEKLGLNREQFEACLRQADMSRIERDFNDAKAAGGQGTPYTVFIVGDKKVPLVGAQPYVAVKTFVDAMLKTSGSASGSGTSSNLVSPTAGAEPYPAP
jgi:protein-disulfide isomerase